MIKRTIILEEFDNGWCATCGSEEINLVVESDEQASILWPDDSLTFEHPEDALAQVLAHFGI